MPNIREPQASTQAFKAAFVCLFLLPWPGLSASATLKLGDVSVGRNLEAFTTVALSEPAPAGDLQLTLTSQDSSRLLLSRTPDVPGQASIVLTVKSRYRESPEFWLHALGDQGDVTYTASAPGYEGATAEVHLTPSGIAIWGPFGQASPGFTTTPRGWPSKLTLHAVRLDSSLNVIETQYVRGGYTLEFKLACSDPSVGRIEPPLIQIPNAAEATSANFIPARAGTTTIRAEAAQHLRTPARLASVVATVKPPGIAVADDLTIGENLQGGGALSLGEPAPPGGVTVTLTSANSEKLLLSDSPTAAGRPSIDIHMAEGSVNRTYYLQALGRDGVVRHTAEAPGYADRAGAITLAPSGVIITTKHHGPPDEAELFRPESAGGPRNSVIAPLHEAVEVNLMTAFLDRRTKRVADITVQQLRGGFAVEVSVSNSDPSVGTLPARATVAGGTERSPLIFHPKAPGKTVLTVETPSGFVRPSNSTELVVVVKE